MSIQAVSYVLELSNAKLGDRCVLLSIANHADKYGEEAWPSIATMASEANVSERTVYTCLDNLAQQGEIECSGERKNRHGRPTKIWCMPRMSKPVDTSGYETDDNLKPLQSKPEVDNNSHNIVEPSLNRPIGSARKTKGTSKIPPDFEDVRRYGAELSMAAGDVSAFYDHFTSNGWKVGGRSAMKDWQAALRTWKRRSGEFGGRGNESLAQADARLEAARKERYGT